MSGAWGRGRRGSRPRPPPVQAPPLATPDDEDAELERALAESAKLAAAEAARPSAADEDAMPSRVLKESASAARGEAAAASAPLPPPPSSYPSLPRPTPSTAEAESPDDADLRRALEESARIASAGDGQEAGMARAIEESKQDLFAAQRRMLERFAADKEAAEREARAAAACAKREARESEGRARAEMGEAGARPRRRRVVDASKVLGFYSEHEQPQADAGGGSGFGFGNDQGCIPGVGRGRGRGHEWVRGRRGRGGRGASGGRGRGRGRGRGGRGAFGFEGGSVPGFCSGGADHRHRRPVGSFADGPVPEMHVPQVNSNSDGEEAVPATGQSSRPVVQPTAEWQTVRARPRSSSLTTVNAILDGENIGREYGSDTERWEGRGVELAHTYFTSRGHCVQVILPETLLALAPPDCSAALARIEAVDPGVISGQEGATARVDLLTHAVTSAHIADEPTVLVSNYTFSEEAADQGGSMRHDCQAYLARFRVGFSWQQDELIPASSSRRLGL